jgi:large subunit ribosomal protein L22
MVKLTMPKWGYSITDLDPEKTTKIAGRELRISPKHATEICRAIKGMKLEKAKEFLEQVIAKKTPVPFRRYKKKVGHRHGMQKSSAGRYPTKAAGKILGLLRGAEANAEFRSMDVETMRIIHASAYAGSKLENYYERAHGRSSPKFEYQTHVELVLEQTEKPSKEEK